MTHSFRKRVCNNLWVFDPSKTKKYIYIITVTYNTDTQNLNVD